MKDLIARMQRELPDTDRTRYDVAYERGRAQARTTLVVGGIALGSAIGAGLVWLLDPARGADRRAALAERVTALRSNAGGTGGGPFSGLQERVRAFAAERGIGRNDGASETVERTSDRSAYGHGYVEGFGQTKQDPDAPGSQVVDPIDPGETLRHGASGPVAGAAMSYDESQVKPLSDEERATNP